MKKKLNTTYLSTAKCALNLLLCAGVAMGCSNKGDEQASIRDFAHRKRAEAFISKLDMPQRLELLLLETRGDTALLAKLLMAPKAWNKSDHFSPWHSSSELGSAHLA